MSWIRRTISPPKINWCRPLIFVTDSRSVQSPRLKSPKWVLAALKKPVTLSPSSAGGILSFAKTRSDGKPCFIIALANEMNQVKGRVTIAADNHVTQRYVPPHPASQFSRTARYRCGNVGFSFRFIFGEPDLFWSEVVDPGNRRTHRGQ